MKEDLGEIRPFLMKMARKRKLEIREYISQDNSFFVTIEKKGYPQVIAISRESMQNALVKAFFAFLDSEFNFID